MSEHTAVKVEAAVRAAVHEAVKAVGLANFKRCSFFLSNERTDAAVKKAA